MHYRYIPLVSLLILLSRLTPGPSSQYSHPTVSPRDIPSSNRASFYSQESESPLGYTQGFHTRQERFQPMTNFQAGSAESMDWNDEYQQQRYARQAPSHYPTQQAPSQNMYRNHMINQPQMSQHPPPVPPERLLPSTGPTMQEYERLQYERSQTQSQRQPSYGVGQFHPHAQYVGRGNPSQSINLGGGQESYPNMPARTLPPPTQQIAGVSSGPTPSMNYPIPGNLQGMPGQQPAYDPQYPYGQYPGHQQYR